MLAEDDAPSDQEDHRRKKHKHHKVCSCPRTFSTLPSTLHNTWLRNCHLSVSMSGFMTRFLFCRQSKKDRKSKKVEGDDGHRASEEGGGRHHREETEVEEGPLKRGGQRIVFAPAKGDGQEGSGKKSRGGGGADDSGAKRPRDRHRGHKSSRKH